MEEEFLEVVSEDGTVRGLLPRSVVHGNPELLHRVVHVLVFDRRGRLLLQKRSMKKDVAPGRWDTSVGGHMNPGESLEDAAKREMSEELGIVAGLKPLYSYIHANPYESELVQTFLAVADGGFVFDPDEIDELRFWELDEIMAAMDGDALSENFKHEIRTYIDFAGR